MIDRLRRRLDVVALVALAYLPTLTAAIGRGVADTKLYLFLDPARLVADARYTWDPQQFGGWVPHQTALYIWPSGPWFWLADTLGLPDWFAHRLWIGTILVMAGLGVRFAGRVLGLGALGAFTAAVVYQLSPYVLPYVSRTSVMLLPWAGLGWIVGFTALAVERRRWREAAIVALVVLTVGATNATATLVIAPAPVLWLMWSAMRRDVRWRDAAATAARIGVLSLAVSLWWIVKLAVQGRYGAPVLSFSETLEAVSATSTAPEIARGLGYWLFYVSDPYIATTTAAAPHLTSGVVIAANFAIVVFGLVGLVVARWAVRGYAAILVLGGTLLGVGAHTLSDPSFLQRLVYDDSRSGLALALRSSSRAVPLVTFGLALGIGALVAALTTRPIAASRPRLAPITAGVVVVIAILGLPALRTGGYVDPALERDDQVPAAWTEAANRLDEEPDGGRVLQLPGQESASFRWGYTVDPPLPGLSERPLIARDWLPAGSAAAMDLLYALDDRIQSGVLEPSSVAPVARWLGADTIWVPGDIAYDRFDTARPEPTLAALTGAPGIGDPETFGEPRPDVPSVPMLDEDTLADTRIGAPIAPVTLLPVEGVDRIRSSSRPSVVVGSGDGLVDAAAAGVLDGRSMVRYLAAIAPADREAAMADAPLVVVTDSNRLRAHQWRGSQDVVGLTEDGERPAVLVRDPSDERLDVFPDEIPDDRTVAEQRGPVRAAASRYGDNLRYTPEDRPAMAVDGDLATAWTVADRSDPLGQFIDVTADRDVTSVRLVQPLDPTTNRWISVVRVVLDPDSVDRTDVVVTLDDTSRSPEGQSITLPRASRHVRLVVTETAGRDRPELSGLDAVGFAEIDLGLGPSEEVVVLPHVAVPSDTPVAVVMSRHRIAASDRWRTDPEPRLVRELPPLGRLELTAMDVRLDRRADDSDIAALLGADVPVASSRLLGHPSAGGWAAVDGDTATAWTTAFAGARGATLTIPSVPMDRRLTISQRDDGRHSVVTRILIERGDAAVERDVTAPDADGRSAVTLPRSIVDATGDTTITIVGIDARTTVDRRTFDLIELPTAIVEIAGIGRFALPTRFDTTCRDDVLAIDGDPVPVTVRGSIADAFAGEVLTTAPCDGAPTAFDDPRSLRSGTPPALEVDRVVLRTPDVEPDLDTAAPVALASTDRTHRRLVVTGCAEGCWMSSGEGRNVGWRATVDGEPLGEPTMVDGGMGAWRLPPGADTREVVLTWSGQRAVDMALAVSGASVLGLVVMLVVTRRRRIATSAVAAEVGGCTMAVIDRRTALATVAAVAVVVALAVSVESAVVITAVAGAIFFTTRRPVAVGMTGAALAAFLTGVILWRQRTGGHLPDFGWIGFYDDLHRPFVVALALATVAAVSGAVREQRR